MSSIQRGAGLALGRLAAAFAAVALVLVLTALAPSFAFLGPRGDLFGWLAYATLLTAGLPGVVMVAAYRRPLSECGLAWGKSRRDALFIALAVAAALGAAWLLSRSPAVRAYYPHYTVVKDVPLLWVPITLAFAVYSLSWEMAFRGFLVLGVANEPGAPRWLGPTAVLAQTALYTIAHLHKPPVEAWLSVAAGLVLGFAALRTRSVLPGLLVHFTLSTSLNLFCVYG
jgi:membrane protease YdiL (CAAX protease family)